MSQYILFTAKDNTGFCGIEGMPFYQKHAKILFEISIDCEICTFPSFDQLCMDAQDALLDGTPISNTTLFSFIRTLKDEEFYSWYGSECGDLTEFSSFNALVNHIEKSLTTASGELYIHYKKSNNTPTPT